MVITKQHIDFNQEKHEYHVNGVPFNSVSKMVDKISPEFDAKAISRGVACARLKKANRPLTKANVAATQRVVLAEWKKTNEDAIARGNLAHQFAEDFILDNTLDPLNDQCIGVIEYLTINNREVLEVEFMLHSLEYPVCGTFDLLLKDNDGKIILSDWKSNNDLFKNYKGKTLAKPLDHLLSNPFNKYQFQLNMYAYMLSEIGVEVDEIELVWLGTDELVFEGEPYEHHTVFKIERWSKETMKEILDYIFKRNDN